MDFYKCSNCEQVKSLSEFYKDKSAKKGHKSHCKSCEQIKRNNNKHNKKKYHKQYYKKNKNNILLKQKIYKEINYSKIKKYENSVSRILRKKVINKIWQEKNKDNRKQYKKKYYKENKEYIKLRNKNYKQEHKEHYKYLHRNYYKKYKEELKRKQKDYINNRLSSDIKFKIKNRLRTRIYLAIKHHYKSGRTLELLGCSIDILKNHLQSQFKQGMTWDNYGKWHIDHIKPCTSFDLSKREEQLKCFHYTNLQPLWAKENLTKGCKYV